MRKHTISLASILLLSATSLQAHWQGHWIVGGSVTYAERLGNLDTTMRYTHPLSLNVPTSFIRDQFINTGTQQGVLFGYQVECYRCRYGLELSLDWDNVAEHYTYAFSDANAQVGLPGIAFNGDAMYKRGLTAALSGRAGYAVNKFFMTYLRLGLESSKDHLDVSFFSNPSVYPYNITISADHRQYRYLLGVGGEMSMAQFNQFGLRLEYNFHSKGERLYAYGTLYDNVRYNPFFEAKTMPKMHSMKLSLVWNFG